MNRWMPNTVKYYYNGDTAYNNVYIPFYLNKDTLLNNKRKFYIY